MAQPVSGWPSGYRSRSTRDRRSVIVDFPGRGPVAIHSERKTSIVFESFRDVQLADICAVTIPGVAEHAAGRVGHHHRCGDAALKLLEEPKVFEAEVDGE